MKDLSIFAKTTEFFRIFLINVFFQELNEIHNSFLSDLTRVLTAPVSTSSTASFSQSKTLGDVFTHWKDKFVIYGDYCANLTRAQSLTEELCAKNESLNQEILVRLRLLEDF
jgi:guanine nucleotide exchange factor VAV